ncbi:MAG: DUF3850 domain-containing protein [Ruminococcaceae bacterium]|nr:DUF3850 domain-containing protein [Oscillospiraceae bacterium]
MIHALKTLPEFFEAVISGKKKFEVRKCDRPFQVGDLLALNEYDAERKCYTGRSCLVRIDYILCDREYCKSSYVIISFSPMMTALYIREFTKDPLGFGNNHIPMATQGDDERHIQRHCPAEEGR